MSARSPQNLWLTLASVAYPQMVKPAVPLRTPKASSSTAGSSSSRSFALPNGAGRATKDVLTREELRALKLRQTFDGPVSRSASSGRGSVGSASSGLKKAHKVTSTKAMGTKGQITKGIAADGMRALNKDKRDLRTIDEIERQLKIKKMAEGKEGVVDFFGKAAPPMNGASSSSGSGNRKAGGAQTSTSSSSLSKMPSSSSKSGGKRRASSSSPEPDVRSRPSSSSKATSSSSRPSSSSKHATPSSKSISSKSKTSRDYDNRKPDRTSSSRRRREASSELDSDEYEGESDDDRDNGGVGGNMRSVIWQAMGYDPKKWVAISILFHFIHN